MKVKSGQFEASVREYEVFDMWFYGDCGTFIRQII